MPDHPQLDRMREAVTDGHSQEIGQFLDWLGQNGYAVCEFATEPRVEWVPARLSPNDLLAKYFGIDQRALDDERQAILNEFVARQEQP